MVVFGVMNVDGGWLIGVVIVVECYVGGGGKEIGYGGCLVGFDDVFC